MASHVEDLTIQYEEGGVVLVREIDKASDPWGIKMIRYEIRNITPSRGVIDTMEENIREAVPAADKIFIEADDVKLTPSRRT